MDLHNDLRYALRTLRRSPGFTAIAILSLALGIGANTAIFSLIDEVLLKMLPVKDPGRLAVVNRGRSLSYPLYVDLRDRNQVFSGLLARSSWPLSITVGGATERVNGEIVSGNYFEVLGIGAVAGRTLTPEDDVKPGAHPVAVLSHGFWQRRFASDPAVIGRTLLVNGYPFTIVGVTPAGFYGTSVGSSPDLRIPMMMKAAATPTWNGLDNRRSNWLGIMGRLKPGISVPQAEAALNVLYHQIRENELSGMSRVSEDQRKRYREASLTVEAGSHGFAGFANYFSQPLMVLMAVVGMVLLIACANLASLLLARATGRQKEIAIRLALGAGRAALVRQLLTESLLLALAGGVLGVLLSGWAAAALIAALPGAGPVPALSVHPDWSLFGFALGVSLLTGMLFGLAPALRSTKPQLAPALKEEASAVAGAMRSLVLRKALIVSQVALSVLLLAGAGLFTRTLRNLRGVDTGIDRASVVQLSVDPALNGYSRERAWSFYHELIEKVRRLPGVRSAALSDVAFLSGRRQTWGISVEGYQPRSGENMEPGVSVVSDGVFRTLGLPLLLGRDFTARDLDGPQRAAIVNETFARYYFGGKNPIGRRIGFRGDLDIEIVGLVKDGKYSDVKEKSQRFVYMPPGGMPAMPMTLYVRAGDARGAIRAVRREVASLDATLPVYNVKTLEDQVDEMLAQERMVAWLSSFFGFLAALLAAIGLYGVMSYSVLRRTREIGIRVALGAERGRVLWLVLRETIELALIGLLIGLPAALALGRFVTGLLYGIAPSDAATLAGAALLMAAIALLAGLLPARRAMRVDPIVALRYE